MCKEFYDAATAGLHTLAKRYNAFCADLNSAVDRAPEDPWSTCYNYARKQIRHVKNDWLPKLRQNTPDVITKIAQKSFWIVPTFAFLTRFWGAGSTALFTAACSTLNVNSETRKLSEDLAFVGLALSASNIGIKAVQLFVTRNPSCLISIIFDLFSLVKCGLIVEGKNHIS